MSVSVSSLALGQGMRTAMARMQRDLSSAQKESSSGRAADLGLALGSNAARDVSLNRELDQLKTIGTGNSLVSSRLSAAQGALKQLGAGAQDFLSSLTASLEGNTGAAVLQSGGQNMLSSLTALMNTAVDGDHVFGGANTGEAPIADWSAVNSPAKKAFDDAFAARFGFSQDDPAAANISANDMNAFLDDVQDQFLGNGWAANWSKASDEGIASRIALSETADTAVSANDRGIRKLAFAAAAVAGLMTGSLGSAARRAVMERAVSLTGGATGDIAAFQGRIGVTEKRVSDASDRVSAQADAIEMRIGKLEGVDPYEAATRVTGLMQQIENSYALTARLQQLSLVKYLS